MTDIDRTQEEGNKKVVTAFYEEAHFDGDVDGAITRHVGATYTQHTPAAEDGVEGLRAYIKAFLAAFPNAKARHLPGSRWQARRTLGRRCPDPRCVEERQHDVLT